MIPSLLRNAWYLLAIAVALGILLPIAACTTDDPFDPGFQRDESIIYGDLRLRSQTDVDSMVPVREIVGNLTISGGSSQDLIRNLTGLTNLKRVSGRLQINGLSAEDFLLPLAGLESVGELEISRCDQLTDLSGLAPTCRIDTLSLKYCGSLSSLPADGLLGGIARIELADLPLLAELSGLETAANLRELLLVQLRYQIPLAPVASLAALRRLVLERMVVESLPDVTSCPDLQRVTLDTLPGLTSLSGLTGAGSLRRLDILSCPDLAGPEGLRDCPRLGYLRFYRCDGLVSLAGMTGLSALDSLSIDYCDGLTGLGGLPVQSSLKWLKLYSCDDLADLGGLAMVPALQTLQLRFLDDLQRIGPWPADLSVQGVDIGWCEQLTDLGGMRIVPGGDLSIRSCDLLPDLTTATLPPELGRLQFYYLQWRDLSGLEELEAVDHLHVYSCGLENLDGLDRLGRIPVSLSINGNSELTDIDALSALTQVGDDYVWLMGNARLDSCVVADHLARWQPTGEVLVRDNGPCAGGTSP